MSSMVEQAAGTTASSASTSGTKRSMFATKIGFVIPKNKLLGSLIPPRGAKKGGQDIVNEESSINKGRKTKWGPDLKQDSATKKGRALAYQTRLDQIDHQLSSGTLEMLESQDPLSDNESASRWLDKETSKLLEIEKREAIGEILKLNPTFKAPADYKPVLKEAKIPIPVKEYYGFNFTNLIFGTARDNQKQLEKETGAKVRVFGRKKESGNEVEITTSLEKEANGAYEELYVLVSADTYEKVDAAVAVIELLIAPVSANAASGTTTLTAASAESPEVVDARARTPDYLTSSAANQGTGQPIAGSGHQGHFQQFPGPWFSAGSTQNPLLVPSGYMTPANVSIPLSHGPAQHIFPPQPGGGSLTQNLRFHSPRPHQPQYMQGPYAPQGHPISNSGLPSNAGMSVLQSTPTQSSVRTPPQYSLHQPPPITFSPVVLPVNSSSQTSSNEGSTEWPHQPMGVSQPLVSGTGFNLSQRNMSPRTPNLVIQSASIPLPVTSARPANPNSLSERPFSFNPTASSIASPRLLQSKLSDFTFQPQRPQHPVSNFVPQPGSQHSQGNIPQMMQPQTPQNPFVRHAMQPTNSPLASQGYMRPPVSNQLAVVRPQLSVDFGGSSMPPPGPFRNPTFSHPNLAPPQMQPRNFSLASAGVNRPGPFPPRGSQMQFNQNFPASTNQPRNSMSTYPGRPASSMPSGGQQVYDPFSPTSLSFNPRMKGPRPNVQRQESDPEYEDLMASVGVK